MQLYNRVITNRHIYISFTNILITLLYQALIKVLAETLPDEGQMKSRQKHLHTTSKLNALLPHLVNEATILYKTVLLQMDIFIFKDTGHYW